MKSKTGAVLVTGGAGYVGSHTCKALAHAGYLPVTFDSLDHGHSWAVKWGPLVRGNVADAELLLHTMREYSIDAVLHFAAYACPSESMIAPAKYFSNNLCNTLILLECMVRAGIQKIVFSSTCATYGIPAKLPIIEDTPQLPISPYGESKLAVERMLRWWGVAHGLRSVILRYFNAAGADPEAEIGEAHDPETHLAPNAIDAAQGSRPALQIFGSEYATQDGTAVRDYIHVSDLATAHVGALQYLARDGRSTALNLGTGIGYSVREVVGMVEAVGGRSVPVIVSAGRPGDPPELVASAANAYRILQWRPHRSTLSSIVESAWRWHLVLRSAARSQKLEKGASHGTTHLTPVLAFKPGEAGVASASSAG